MSRLGYYLRSIPTLLRGFEDPWLTSRVFLSLPGALPAEVRLRENGWRFSVRSAMDMWIVKETCLDHGYLAWDQFEPFWTVLDVGAGLGDFTVLACKACPEGLVHAYEPYEQSFGLLKGNLALNRLENVACFREAAGAAGTRLEPGSLSGEPVSTAFVLSGGDSSVAAVTLKEMLSRLPGEDCDLLKIDCEGCEYDFLLRAGLDAIQRVKRITMEAHNGYAGHGVQSLVDHLATSGFTVRQTPNPVHSYLSHIFAERD